MITGSQAAGSDTPGQRVGGYVLRRWLAQGGMAELYLATPSDPARSRQVVVVKRVLPQFAQDKQFARMFAREAQLASALKHPNIVEVFEAAGVDDEEDVQPECFFSMEYVHGCDLSEVLRTLREQGGSIPLANALLITMGMCAGLNHAHDHRDEDGQLLGIVHRDVSPSNVMLSFDGGVKITDFGVAKALALTSFTQAGTRKGKLSYMSPEQAVADAVDRRTDVFAIGSVLFELTTMQRMFGGENELAIMHKLLFRERTRPSEIVSNYPAALEAIVMRATAKEPSERFASALEMRDAIEAYARSANIATSEQALGRFVASVVKAQQHPASDPEFFTSPDNLAPVRLPAEGTVPEVVGHMTIPGSGSEPEAPTSLDGMAGSPALKPTMRMPAVPRDISATPAPRRVSSSPQPVGRPPSSPGFNEINETEIALPPPSRNDFGATIPSPAMAPPLHLSSSVAAAVSPPRRGAPAWTFILAGLLIAGSAIGGVFWLRGQRDVATVPAAAAPAPGMNAAEPAPPKTAPAVVADDPAPDPAPPASVAPPPTVEVAPPAPEPDPVPVPQAAPEDAQPAKPASTRKPARGSHGSKKRKKPAKTTPQPEPEPKAEPKPKPPPPPPPDPDKNKKKKPPTDTLLPIIE